MIERHIQEPIQPELFHAPRFTNILIEDISRTKTEIKNLNTLKRNGNLTYQQRQSGITLEKKLSENLVTFLSLRRGVIWEVIEENEEYEYLSNAEQDFWIEVEFFPNDPIHPFSNNRTSIFVPSIKYSDFTYEIFTNLDNLRGEGVKDSLQALELVGNYDPVMNHNKEFLIKKLNWEIGSVKREKSFAERGKSFYSLDELQKLHQDLIQRRHNELTNQITP